jgi:hypothetical protein
LLDLRGEDRKVISYRILFTKPGFETSLQVQQEEGVSYATDGSALAARLRSEFAVRLQEGISWPAAWTTAPGDGYPEVGKALRGIPEGDRKYVSVRYEVVSRSPASDEERDRAKADVLREIRDTLGDRP